MTTGAAVKLMGPELAPAAPAVLVTVTVVFLVVVSAGVVNNKGFGAESPTVPLRTLKFTVLLIFRMPGTAVGVATLRAFCPVPVPVPIVPHKIAC